jgi:hypothetical protein
VAWVPSTCTKWGLGAWVDHQRREARSGYLDLRRADKLKAIGLTWNLLHEAWEEQFKILLAFRRKHGHCKVPIRGTDRKLGLWVKNQRTRKATLKPEREARLEAVGLIWNCQSCNDAVVEESDSGDDLGSSTGSSDEVIDDAHSSDQARSRRRLKTRSARKPPAADYHETEEPGKSESSNIDSAENVKIGTRLSVIWDDGYYYGGVVTKIRPGSCYIEYYDGENAWHDLGTEDFSIVYPLGTQVYKKFPGHGYYWGEVTVSKHDKDCSFYYEVEYSDGDLEQITDEPDSAQLLEELHFTVIAAHKRKRQDSKIAVADDTRKRKKGA